MNFEKPVVHINDAPISSDVYLQDSDAKMVESTLSSLFNPWWLKNRSKWESDESDEEEIPSRPSRPLRPSSPSRPSRPSRSVLDLLEKHSDNAINTAIRKKHVNYKDIPDDDSLNDFIVSDNEDPEYVPYTESDATIESDESDVSTEYKANKDRKRKRTDSSSG